MVRFYIKGIKEYLASHPDGKMCKVFNGNAYDWFTSQVFCDGEREFHQRFGPTLFDDGIDCKKFLEEQFCVEL